MRIPDKRARATSMTKWLDSLEKNGTPRAVAGLFCEVYPARREQTLRITDRSDNGFGGALKSAKT